MIRFHVLGGLDLHAADGRALRSVIAQPKRTAVLAYLAIASPHGHHRRDTLLGVFWPDSEMERARHSLNQAVYALRRSLGEAVLVSRGSEELGVDPSQLWCDAVELEAALAAGRLADAVELYRGDLLHGFFLSDAPEFERWLEGERLRLRERTAGAAWTLAEREEETRNAAGAASWARRAAALVPDDELALRRLVDLLARVGDRAGALAAYDAFRRRLADTWGGEPDAGTRALVERVRTASGGGAVGVAAADGRAPVTAPSRAPPADASAAAAAPASRPPAAAPLPAPSTPFVGRTEELERVARLLADPACRLVTVIGPGGIGKTRLAIEATAAAAAGFREGVRWVPLAGVASPDLLVAAVAGALGLRFVEGADPAEQLLDALAPRELLLALDNLEHLVGSAGYLTQLLERAPGVKLLVTSREALNVRGEWLCPLRGLGFPAKPEAGPLERYGAVELFVRTAERAGERVDLAGGDGPPVARICRLLEGLPLAIELAAAWVRVLSCEEVSREIENGVRFLAGSLRDVPERHRSLWAAFDHSWNHLDGDERAAFARLSAFRGGFEREAAEAVAGVSLPVLAALIDRSLLRREPGGRFQMLEVLRQFAAERLGDEADAIGERHCDHYTELLRRNAADLTGARQTVALAAVGAEIDNLRAAWRWAAARRSIARLDACAEGLFVFYDVRGWYREGEAAFGSAARELEGADDDGCERAAATLARLLARQGIFFLRLGETRRAGARLERSLAISRRTGDRVETAASLDRLGVVAYNLGRFDRARRLQEESLAIRRELGDPDAVATSLNNLGSLAYATGDYAAARRLCAEGLALQRRLGDAAGAVISLQNLAYIELLLGEEPQAREHLEEALGTARELGSGVLVARALYNLGNVVGATGDAATALGYLEEALAAAVETGAEPLALDARIAMAGPLRRQGRTESALGLLGYVLGHPAAEKRHRDSAERLITELEAGRPAGGAGASPTA